MGKQKNIRKAANNSSKNLSTDGLITHRQKQIIDPQMSLNQSDNSSDLIQGDNALFPQKNKNEQFVHKISELFLKNKINYNNAFNVPLMSIADFAQCESTFSPDDVAWKNLSSILENDYRIYGLRVDSFFQSSRQIANTFSRKGAYDEGKDSNSKPEQSQQVSNSLRVDISKYLQKCSQNLNVGLKTTMLRKDPVFNHTRRQFDQCGLQSLLMNTLPLEVDYGLVINSFKEKRILPGKIHKRITDREQKCFDKISLFELEAQGMSDSYEIHQSMKQLHRSLIKMKIVPDIVDDTQYDRMLGMIKEGKLKSAFEMDLEPQCHDNYDEQNAEDAEDMGDQLSFVNANSKYENPNCHSERQPFASPLQQFHPQYELSMKEAVQIGQPSLQSLPRRARTKQTFQSHLQILQPKKKQAMARSLGSKKKQIKNNSAVICFDSNKKEIIKTVLKAEKRTNGAVPDDQRNYGEINVLSFQEKGSSLFLQSRQEYDSEKKSRGWKLKGKSNKYSAKKQQLNSKKQLRRQALDQSMSSSKRVASIVRIKQKILQILKDGSFDSFIQIRDEFIRREGQTSSSVIFIALLHLSNQRHLKLTALNQSNFQVALI